jgi:hypothetical protein
MADWPAIAGLAVDIAGAWLLARALAFESATDFVRTHQIRGHPGTVDAAADLERARDQAEARIGATLLGLGFAGQLIGAFRDDWPCGADVTAVALAVACIGGALGLRPRYIRRWEGRVFIARARAEHQRRIPSRGEDGADKGVARTVLDYWQELERLGRVHLPDTGTTNFTAKVGKLIEHLRIGDEDAQWLRQAADRMRARGTAD